MDWKLRMHLLTSKAVNSLKVARWSMIPAALVGQEVEVHNGREYVRIKITSKMIGYRIGEFVRNT